ncbi:alveolar macrophage chemotactic factor-like [Erythrolamprus reginae]|uniref:alveolar macrophage chemotactic factor-like n=1 Tax=Erythrolamprus reginae TaxID=121349 RepID=UPI00396C2FD3
MAEGALLQNIVLTPRRKMARQLLSTSFLLLFLFMVLMPSTGNALLPRNLHENGNRCECIATTATATLRSRISSIHLIQPRPHCNVLQAIATLKTGVKVCLDPEAQWVKRIVQSVLNRENQ